MTNLINNTNQSIKSHLNNSIESINFFLFDLGKLEDDENQDGILEDDQLNYKKMKYTYWDENKYYMIAIIVIIITLFINYFFDKLYSNSNSNSIKTNNIVQKGGYAGIIASMATKMGGLGSILKGGISNIGDINKVGSGLKDKLGGFINTKNKKNLFSKIKNMVEGDRFKNNKNMPIRGVKYYLSKIGSFAIAIFLILLIFFMFGPVCFLLLIIYICYLKVGPIFSTISKM
jgi:hypothetical protein